eukprot:5187625-Pyramimonas_sp.AAC.1
MAVGREAEHQTSLSEDQGRCQVVEPEGAAFHPPAASPGTSCDVESRRVRPRQEGPQSDLPRAGRSSQSTMALEKRMWNSHQLRLKLLTILDEVATRRLAEAR